MYQIVHLSAECYPVAKVGGLGDVVGALPKYLNQAGYSSCVVMPRYNMPWNNKHQSESVYSGNCRNEHFDVAFHIVKAHQDTLGFDLYMVDIPGLLFREGVYGYEDDPIRFLFYQQAVLQWLCSWDQRPSVVHAHDHHCGHTAFMLKHCYNYSALQGVKTIFTIHNGLYTGPMPTGNARLFPHFPREVAGFLEWDNRIDPLACAIKCSDRITTVSGGYLQELQEDAGSFTWLYREYAYKSSGILNGIDTQVWDPSNDKLIGSNLIDGDWARFKQQNKNAICEKHGFDSNLPLCVFIGRLATEKGGDLIVPSVGEFVHQTKGMNFYLLGSGASYVEDQFRHISAVFPQYISNYIGYNEGLAHSLYAAADFLLMPSLVEPCGLNQMYALRYGTIPIVRSTGGLKDSVVDFGDFDGYGIRFNNPSQGDVVYSLHRALKLYWDKATFNHVRNLAVNLDFSWEKAVNEYIWVYKN